MGAILAPIMPIEKPLAEITLEDVYALVDADDPAPETQTLEFKRNLAIKDPREEKSAESGDERLAGHVAALANADGGDLILGVLDLRSGVEGSERVVGIESDDLDETARGIRDHLRVNCDPPLTELDIHPIRMPEANRCVLVLRIPASQSIHLTKADKKHPGYYCKRRYGDQSSKIDMAAIREVILARETVYDSMRRHREERDAYYQGRIGRGVFDVGLRVSPEGWHTPFLVVYLLPVSGFGLRKRDLILRSNLRETIMPLDQLTRWDFWRKDLDGIRVSSLGRDPYHHIQAQYKCFRNGAAELMISSAEQGRLVNAQMVFRSAIALTAMLRVAHRLEVGREIYAGISLHSLGGNLLGLPIGGDGDDHIRDALVASPLVSLGDVDIETAAVHDRLLDAGDLLFQAAGHHGYREFMETRSGAWPWQRSSLF